MLLTAFLYFSTYVMYPKCMHFDQIVSVDVVGFSALPARQRKRPITPTVRESRPPAATPSSSSHAAWRDDVPSLAGFSSAATFMLLGPEMDLPVGKVH